MTDAEVVMDALRDQRWRMERMLDTPAIPTLPEWHEAVRTELAYLNAAIARRIPQWRVTFHGWLMPERAL